MRRAAFLVLLVTTACRPKQSTQLNDALDAARAQLPCRAVIPLEWARSFPVPADKGGRKFHIFFYPMEAVPPADPKLFEAQGDAVIDLVARAPISCNAWSKRGRPIQGKRWPQALDGLSYEKTERLTAKLMDRTEKVAKIYSTSAEPQSSEKQLMAEYLDLFIMNSEPLYSADYYRLNPEFWEWLRSRIGRSIPKA